MSIEEKYKFTTLNESVKEKDWAAGSSKRSPVTELVFNELEGEMLEINYPPALWKIFDEPMVNALDHVVRQYGTPHPVTKIEVTFQRNGVVEIKNNGPGIEVVVHKTASEKLGREVYVPSFIFGEMFQGSNREKSGDNIIGGTNGVGTKITNCMSSWMEVETVDQERGLHFFQRWTDGMKSTTPPVIKKYSKAPFTIIRFLPDYNHFGYKLTADCGDKDVSTVDRTTKDKKSTSDMKTKSAADVVQLSESDYSDLDSLFRTRSLWAAVYAEHSSRNVSKKLKGKCKVWYNGSALMGGVPEVCKILFPRSTIRTCVLKPTAGNFIWELAVCIHEETGFPSEISVVNGIVCTGKHTAYIRREIVDAVKTGLKSKFNDTEMRVVNSVVGSDMTIVLVAKISNPGWSGQRKDVLDYNSRKFSVYKLPKVFAKAVCEDITEYVSRAVLQKAPSASGKKKNVIDYDKYRDADAAGGKESPMCQLIVVEGDSAMNRLKAGITDTIGYKHHGIISTGGVFINTRTKSTVKRGASGQYTQMSNQMTENKFFKAFCQITGLSPHYAYDPLAAGYKKEMRELRYGSICMFVDQDLDGKGNILSSMLSTFNHLWPNLLRAGYVKWFCSPIIRAYPNRGGKVEQFMNVVDYERWQENAPPHTTRYYKGIGTHSRDETISMFKRYKEQILTYTVSPRCDDLFDVYFGSDPDRRKLELSTPASEAPYEALQEQQRTHQITCANHLLWEAKPYQLDNIERKLDHIIDGQNQAGRKILDGVLKAFSGENKPMKVAVLAGYISERENYHHGEASLGSSITGRGFIGPGGRQLPIIVPLSNFGSQLEGGKDASPPRYIFCKGNRQLTSLLFPADEYHLLTFNFDEGERSEPKFFVPILPMAVLESSCMPAHGWKIETTARDVFTVIENVRRMIHHGSDCKLLNMLPATYDPAPYKWNGKFKYIRGVLHTMGTYEWKYASKQSTTRRTLHITALPLRSWVVPYVEALNKKKNSTTGSQIISEIRDSSNDRKVSIEVDLCEGAMEHLEGRGDYPWTDDIEEYFSLRQKEINHINLMDMDGSVCSMPDYESVIRRWFPVRKEMYAKRINRQVILLQLKIIMWQNIIRYVGDTNLRMGKRKLAEMIRLLQEMKYNPLHKALLSSPKFTPTEELSFLITGCGAVSATDSTAVKSNTGLITTAVNSESTQLQNFNASGQINYDYLLDLSDKMKSEEKLLEYKNKLQSLQDELSELLYNANRGEFYGAAIWLSELRSVESVIKDGFRTSWVFDEYQKYDL